MTGKKTNMTGETDQAKPAELTDEMLSSEGLEGIVAGATAPDAANRDLAVLPFQQQATQVRQPKKSVIPNGDGGSEILR